MGVSFSDIVALAKAGYKPAEVKELISLGEKSEAEQKPEEPHAAAGAIQEPEPASGEPGVAEENVQPAKTEDPVDYKSLYEQAKADLDKAQKANVSQNAAATTPAEDPDKTLREIVGSYL